MLNITKKWLKRKGKCKLIKRLHNKIYKNFGKIMKTKDLRKLEIKL